MSQNFENYFLVKNQPYIEKSSWLIPKYPNGVINSLYTNFDFIKNSFVITGKIIMFLFNNVKKFWG